MNGLSERTLRLRTTGDDCLQHRKRDVQVIEYANVEMFPESGLLVDIAVLQKGFKFEEWNSIDIS